MPDPSRPTGASIAFDRVAEDYDESRGGMRRGRDYALAIAPHLPGNGTILEVGVGTGLVAAGLSERGYTVVGVDLSPAMIAKSRSRLGARVAVADAGVLPVADHSVAAAYSAHVIHLVADPVTMLSEIARVLAPGAPYVSINPHNRDESNDVTATIKSVNDRFRRRKVDAHAASAWAAEAGLVQRSTEVVEHGEIDADSPNEHADKVENKLWSWTWDIPQAEWDVHVVPALAALRALPDPHRQRRMRVGVRVAVYFKT